MGHEFSRAVVVVLWLVSCGALTFFNSLLLSALLEALIRYTV
jgi:hypothetical protein